MTKRLEGKLALVTGGARGIGKAISLVLAKAGADIIINYRSSADAAKELIKEIEAMDRKAYAFKADVSSMEDIINLEKEISKELGTIDILVNNAGITRDTLLMRMKEEDFDSVININLKGVFNCTKVFSKKMMKKRAGSIINITSVVGITGNAGQSNYSASKAGVIGFTKSIAKEIGSRGITVNAVAPGFIETDMTDILNDEIKETYVKNIPLGRMGMPEDVAKVVEFLASEDARYVTGQVINVDGGMVM